jgi:hypothetical protein
LGNDISAFAAEKLVITMKVTSQGLVTTSVPMQEKKMTLPKGTRVKLILEYADTNQNAHQFSLVSSHMELMAPPITPDGRKSATLEFTVGERGENFYRLSCELPCIAMDALTDYLILVGPAKKV